MGTMINLPAEVTSINGLIGAVQLTAGSNITLVTTGNSIRINASAASPGGSTNAVQYNVGGVFTGSNALTFDGSTLTCLGNITAQSSGTFGDFNSDGNLIFSDGGGGLTMQYFTSDQGGIFSDGVGNLHTGNIAANAISCAGFRISTITPGAYPFTIPQGTSNAVTLVDTSSNRSIVLATPTAVGTAATIIDATGSASTHNITVTSPTGTINGAASYVINTNRGGASFISNGTNYFVTSKM